MTFSEAEIIEEEKHFANVISTFRHYEAYSLAANNRRRKDYYALSQEDRELLDKLGYKGRLKKVDEAIIVNAKFLDDLVADPDIFGHHDDFREDTISDQKVPNLTLREHSHSHVGAVNSHKQSAGPKTQRGPTDSDMDKLRSTLKQFVRDWSEEGKIEREACYDPIKDALIQHFAEATLEDRRKIRVLVPGTGLGRLAYDIASLGFTCQGNEFSHYMLLASHFVLNRTQEINEHTIFPYVHSFSNMPNELALLRPVSIPDILPSNLPPGSKFSLVAGDFEEIYGASSDDDHIGKWNAIVTCFFIDTAKNIIKYLRIFHQILAPGGVWINLGPTLWHWENNTTNDISIELDLEQVKQLVLSTGFEILEERTIDATYTNNAQSMLGYVYHTSFWTAVKK